MNKIIVTIISVIVIFFAVFMGVKTYKVQKNNEVVEETQNITQISEEILDDCTEEWEELETANKDELQANSQEQVQLSPYCSFTFKTYYSNCGHTSNQYNNIPKQLVNKNKEEIETIYSEWIIETFESNQVVLTKEEDGECGEHYILKDVGGKIIIYVINGEKEEEYQTTEISTDYLTETDKITIKNGLKVYGKESLNQILEDFE